MREKVALECIKCDFSAIRKTPDSQERLREMIKEFLYCPACGCSGIVQVAAVDEQGMHHLYV